MNNPDKKTAPGKQDRKAKSRLKRFTLWFLVPLGLIGACTALALYVKLSINCNFNTVVPNQVYRSAHPSIQKLSQWKKKYGIKTVINLRGSGFKGYEEYSKAVKGLGLNLITLRFSAKRPPPTPVLHQLIDALSNSNKPILLHCRSGIDRAGMASTLAQMSIGNESYDDAIDQRPIWSKHAKRQDGYIETLFEDYEADRIEAGKSTGSWTEFHTWAMNQYHPKYYRILLEHAPSIQARPGQKLSFPIKLTNKSKMLIPSGQAGWEFGIAVFQGDSVKSYPDKQFGKRARLPREDLAPGQSLELVYKLRIPNEPGEYELKVDLIDENRSYFGRQGSKVTNLKLHVITDQESAQ